MYHIKRLLNIKLLILLISLEEILCTIDGSFVPRRRNVTRTVEDPCNPLYWYPRNIPEYCFYKKEMSTKPPPDLRPIPVPLPVQMPPMPIPMPIPMPPMLPPMISQSIMPLPYPLPFGIPLAPTNPMLPVAGFSYPSPPPPIYVPHPVQPHIPSPFTSYVPPFGIHRKPMTMVPGLPGLVSPDGGINILPFSDAYSDILEKHKQRMIRKRLQKLLDEYDGWPSRNSDEDIRQYSNDINEDDHMHLF